MNEKVKREKDRKSLAKTGEDADYFSLIAHPTLPTAAAALLICLPTYSTFTAASIT